MLTAFFDSNVFFGARLRSFVMEAAVSRLFRARWSRQVHAEWIAAVLRKRGDLAAETLEAIATQMNIAVPEAVVDGYQGLVAGLTLPDPDDRHVLAAAIVAGADVIVTFNLDDFPAAALAGVGLQASHPDAFFLGLESVDPGILADVAARDLAHYRNPPLTKDRYLGDLAKAGVPRLVDHLGTLRGGRGVAPD